MAECTIDSQNMDSATIRVRELLDQKGIKWYDVPAYGRQYHITRWKDTKTGHTYEMTRMLGTLFSEYVELTVHNGYGDSKELCLLPDEVIRVCTNERLAAAYGIL